MNLARFFKWKLSIIVAIAGVCILGYGYWHSSTHASFHIQLNFKDITKANPGIIPETTIRFLDSDGRILATGISDQQYHFVHLIHPEVGDCHEIEKSAAFSKAGRNLWQACFENLSTWISTWADTVRQVSLKTPDCAWRNIPVTVSKYNADWYLWWVPHPHIGGKPYTYYSLTITVDEKNCMD